MRDQDRFLPGSGMTPSDYRSPDRDVVYPGNPSGPSPDREMSSGADDGRTQEGGGAVRSLRLGEGIDGRSNVKEEPHDFDDLPPEVREALLRRSATRNPERSTLSKLEGKYMMALLIYLDRMSPVLKSDIYNDISRSGRMTDKLNDLLSMGLIEMYRTGRTDSKVIVITDKGRKVAGIISEMIGIIEGDTAKTD